MVERPLFPIEVGLALSFKITHEETIVPTTSPCGPLLEPHQLLDTLKIVAAL